MNFRLHYRGPLHSNADFSRKFAIQRALHPQLRTLWESSALSVIREQEWTLPGGLERWQRKRGPLTFLPLVAAHMDNVAALDITWLRPGPLGSLVHSNWDIDNRLKTLFDALRVPTVVPASSNLQGHDGQLYTLLDDDALITEVRVTTDRLLEAEVEDMHVEMIIAVEVRPSNRSLPQSIWVVA